MLLYNRLLPVFVVFISTSSEVYAYLDPGTGSILLQGLIAAVATGLATGKFWWHRVKSIFVKSEESEAEDSPNDQP